MNKSTYFSSLLAILNPHTNEARDYPHKEMITFVVVTSHAPKSTYSPKLTEEILILSDGMLRETVDDMMGLTMELEWGDMEGLE